MDIEGRLRALENRAEIQELIAAYCRVLDDRNFEGVGDLYCDNAIFDGTAGRIVGRAGIVAYYRERMAPFGPTWHYPHGIELSLGENEATGVVAAHAELAIEGETVWVALRYHDTYRRAERWQFYEREVRLLYVSKLSELPTTMADALRVRWPGTAPQAAAIGPDK